MDNKRKIEKKESKFQYNPPSKRRKLGKKVNTSKNTDKKIKSVMFVPYTKHSELAGRLRESEESMAAMTGYKLKIVERGGTKLVDILHKANPWAGQDCGRLRCLLCTTKKDEGKKNSQDCKKRNCVYETYCMTCMQRQDRITEEKYG